MATRDKHKATELKLLTELLARIAPGARRVVGLDLSISRPGFAVIYTDHTMMHTDHLVTAPVPDAWGHGHAERTWRVADKAVAYVVGGSMRADLVIIEAAFGGARGNDDGLRIAGAFDALMVGHGIDVPVVAVTNTQLKCYACGTTKDVDKARMALAARDRLGWTGNVHDEADALWLAAYGWALLDRPVLELPKTHTAVIDRHLGRATKTRAAA